MKTKWRAIWLAGCAVGGFTLTSALLNIVLPFLRSRDLYTIVANPEALRDPGNIAALAGTFLLLEGALIGMGAFWLYRFFGERYFDRLAAWRWALFAMLFALWLQLPTWWLPNLVWWLAWLYRFGGVFATFFLARRLLPLSSA